MQNNLKLNIWKSWIISSRFNNKNNNLYNHREILKLFYNISVQSNGGSNKKFKLDKKKRTFIISKFRIRIKF